ncbi:hypothetical protein [Streptomyces sp. NPDC058548]|uniref:hypothetical protein n=1 Tax=Streptomyces sp. NPDC058548 TaxID=3346545 RepID=UPI00364A4FF2
MSGWRGWFRQRRTDELALIDADITEFGEELARHVFVPTGQDSDALVLADYERALDAYERAKRDFVGDRDHQDAEDVLRALEEGRHALACAEARASGRPLPARRPLCFFDPRHGPATTEIRWSPPEGAARLVDVCAADGVRLREGLPPIATGRPSVVTGVPAPHAHRTDHPAHGAPRAAPGQGAHRRPYRIWPPGTPAAQRAEGTGDSRFELVRPDASTPVILVVRLDAVGSAELFGHESLLGHEGRRNLLKRGASGRRAVVPLPPDGHASVRLGIETRGSWRAWLHAPDHVPEIESKLRSKGSYVFRYSGGPATIRVDQRGGGTFWLEELTDGFAPGQRLITGKGTCNGESRLNGPALIHVRSSGDWNATLTGRTQPKVS